MTHEMLAETHIKLGNLMRDDQRNEEAAEEYKQAVQIRQELEKMDRKFGPRLAMTYYNLAGLYFNDLQKKAEAKQYFQMARDTALQYYNEDADCANMVLRIRNLPDDYFLDKAGE